MRYYITFRVAEPFLGGTIVYFLHPGAPSFGWVTDRRRAMHFDSVVGAELYLKGRNHSGAGLEIRP